MSQVTAPTHTPFPQQASAPESTPSTLPILDLQDFTAGDGSRRERFVATLRDTAHGVGFFYLTGYGASPAQVAEVLNATRAFFALPDSDKAAIHMANSPHFRGFTAAGDEITQGERDWREQLDIGAERHPIQQTPGLPAWTRLQGPNQWPVALPTLKPTLLAWQDTLTEAAQQLLRALALALGQPVDRFDAAFADTPVQHLKIIRYPGRAEDESQQGVGPHKDAGCLTLLLQDTQAGLQVLDRDHPQGDKWIDAPPIPGTVIINIGEVLEILSDGYLRANIHRVTSPPAEADRISVAFFLSPRLDAHLPELALPATLATRARGVENNPLNPLLPHTGQNLLKGRLRSHPDVADRHYADVLVQNGIAPGKRVAAYA